VEFHHVSDANVNESAQVTEPDSAPPKPSMYEDKAVHELERKSHCKLVKVVDLSSPTISAAPQPSSRPRVIPNRVRRCTVAPKAQLGPELAVWLDWTSILRVDSAMHVSLPSKPRKDPMSTSSDGI
jgi:hypothetical protein